MEILHRCPRCQADLPPRQPRCPGCGAEYPRAQVAGTLVIDYLAGSTQAGGDLRDDAYRPIDLSALRAPGPGPAARHGKARVLRRLGQPVGLTILDVGCREAPLGRALAAGNDLIGVDLSPDNMLTGAPNALDAGYRQLLLADAHALPLADAQVDLVLATDILEHVLTPERLLAEFGRVLKPGGRLLVTVPNLVSLNNRLSILAGSGVGIEMHQWLRGRSIVNPITGPRYPDQRRHVRWFTLKSLCRMASACGFAVAGRFGYDPVFSRLPGGAWLFRNACQVVGVLCRRE